MKSKRAKYAWLFEMGIMEVDDNEAVIPVHVGDHFGEGVTADVGAKLAVEFVHGFGGERVIVDGLDGGAKGVRHKEVALAMAEVILELLIGAVTSAAPGAKAA